MKLIASEGLCYIWR